MTPPPAGDPMRVYLTGIMDQLWRAAADGDADELVCDIINRIVDDGHSKLATAIADALFLHGRSLWTRAGYIELGEFGEIPDHAPLTLTGTVLHWAPLRTHQGNAYAALALSTGPGRAVRVLVPPAVYDRFGYLIARSDELTVTGTVDRRPVRPSLFAQRIDEVAPAPGG